MSIKLIEAAFESRLPSGPKFVLIALCDNANDSGGSCFPSVAELMSKCSMSARSIFNHLSELEALGAIARIPKPGIRTHYQINPCRFCTPADSAPLQRMHDTPADSAVTPADSAVTPADSAPVTVNEPSIEPSGNRKKKNSKEATQFVLPDWIPQDLWDTWHSTKKRKGTTDSQKDLVVRKLSEWRDRGLDWRKALEDAAVGGWSGIFEPKAPTQQQRSTSAAINKQLATEQRNQSAAAEWLTEGGVYETV